MFAGLDKLGGTMRAVVTCIADTESVPHLIASWFNPRFTTVMGSIFEHVLDVVKDPRLLDNIYLSLRKTTVWDVTWPTKWQPDVPHEPMWQPPGVRAAECFTPRQPQFDLDAVNAILELPDLDADPNPSLPAFEETDLMDLVLDESNGSFLDFGNPCSKTNTQYLVDRRKRELKKLAEESAGQYFAQQASTIPHLEITTAVLGQYAAYHARMNVIRIAIADGDSDSVPAAIMGTVVDGGEVDLCTQIRSSGDMGAAFPFLRLSTACQFMHVFSKTKAGGSVVIDMLDGSSPISAHPFFWREFPSIRDEAINVERKGIYHGYLPSVGPYPVFSRPATLKDMRFFPVTVWMSQLWCIMFVSSVRNNNNRCYILIPPVDVLLATVSTGSRMVDVAKMFDAYEGVVDAWRSDCDARSVVGPGKKPKRSALPGRTEALWYKVPGNPYNRRLTMLLATAYAHVCMYWCEITLLFIQKWGGGD
jgi:hypothetical protein